MKTPTETLIKQLRETLKTCEGFGVDFEADTVAEAALRLEEQQREISYQSEQLAEWLECEPDAIMERIRELRDAERIAWAALHLDMRRIPGLLMTGETHTIRDHKNGGWFRFNAYCLTDNARALIDAAMKESENQK